MTILKLKPGVEITHKKKKHVGEISDGIFKEIYGNLGADEKESKKLFDKMKKKYEYDPKRDDPKKETDEPVKDEPAKSGN